MVSAVDPKPSKLLPSWLPRVPGADLGVVDLGIVDLGIVAVSVAGGVAASEAVALAIVEGFVEVGEDSGAVVMMVTGDGCLPCFTDII